MVQVLEQLGSPAGRIGKGFGQALSEQVPKEIERHRLSSGLKDLSAKAKTGNLTPLELITQSMTIPGMTPERAQQLQPYLENAAVRSQIEKRQPSATNGQAQSQPNQAPAEPSPEGGYQIQTDRRLGTREALRARGDELYLENPLRYKTPDAGYQEAKDEYDRQEGTLSKIDTEFDKKLSAKIQKNGTQTYKDVLGDLQLDFKKKAADDVLSGKMSESQAIDKYSKDALDFTKAKNDLETIGSYKWFTASPKEDRQKIDSIREMYKKNNRLEDFKKELVGLGMSDYKASEIAKPARSNKEIAKILDTQKKRNPIEELAERKRPGRDAEISKQIIKHLKPTDSLVSIANALDEKGYDGGKFLKEIQRQWDDGEITNVSGPQTREFGTAPPRIPTMKDLWIYTITGKDPLGD